MVGIPFGAQNASERLPASVLEHLGLQKSPNMLQNACPLAFWAILGPEMALSKQCVWKLCWKFSLNVFLNLIQKSSTHLKLDSLDQELSKNINLFETEIQKKFKNDLFDFSKTFKNQKKSSLSYKNA